MRQRVRPQPRCSSVQLARGRRHVTFVFAAAIVAANIPPAAAQDMDQFPYFQYLIEPGELEYLTTENANVLLRPMVSNLWAQAAQVSALRDWYRWVHPQCKLGRYFSAIHCSPPALPGALRKYYEECPDAWILRRWDGEYYYVTYGGESRKCVNITIPAARAAMIEFYIREGQGWDQLLLDHFVYRYTNLYSDSQPGKAAIDAGFLALVREYQQRGGVPMIINAITRPEVTWAELTPYVGGIFCESALASSYYHEWDWREFYLRTELDAYRTVLNARKILMLTNNRAWPGAPDPTAASDPLVMGPLLAAAVCLVKNPGDQVSFNTNITRNHNHDPQPWHDWWRELGLPLGPRVWNHLVVSRQFANGSVEFDTGVNRPRVRVTINGETYRNYVELPKGDVNCDGSINGFDITPFLDALTHTDGYFRDRYPACEPQQADVNEDGSVNGFDLEPFKRLLGG